MVFCTGLNYLELDLRTFVGISFHESLPQTKRYYIEIL